MADDTLRTHDGVRAIVTGGASGIGAAIAESLHAAGATVAKVFGRPEEEAAAFAEASPYPTVEDITKDIYWEEDHPEKKVSQGRIIFE